MGGFWEAFGRLLCKYMSIADDKSGGWGLAKLVAYYWLSYMAFAFKSIVHSHHPYIESLPNLLPKYFFMFHMEHEK